jgi:hypothetical protein
MTSAARPTTPGAFPAPRELDRSILQAGAQLPVVNNPPARPLPSTGAGAKDWQPARLAPAVTAQALPKSPTAPAAPPPAAAAPAAPRTAPPEAPANPYVLNIALGQLIGTLAAFLVGPVVLLLGLLYFLRRCGRTGPLFRVELVNAHGPFVAVQAAGAVEQRMRGGLPVADDDSDLGSAQKFDLGPTYEEEMRHRSEAQRQQEEALLRHIFDENVKLREQIEQTPEADAPAPSWELKDWEPEAADAESNLFSQLDE